MNAITLEKPILLCLYGFPGSGKSYLARNLAENLQMANVSADRTRGELFKNPRFDDRENAVIYHLMNYMSEEFLRAGVSVAYDANAARSGQRRALKELAKKNKAAFLLVWLQVDKDSAFARTQKRDRRTADDRFSQDHTQQSFADTMAEMQNPSEEDYIVVSGKHSFQAQKNAIVNRLYQLGLLSSDSVIQNVAKPGLVNLIPTVPNPPAEDSHKSITVS